MSNFFQTCRNVFISAIYIILLPVLLPILYFSFMYGEKHGWFDYTD